MTEEAATRTTDGGGGRGRELAREAGEAYLRTLRHADTAEAAGTGTETEAGAGAGTGDVTDAGDYVIGFAQGAAAGHWVPDGDADGDGALEWVEPQAENCRLSVAVADAVDGRFVPGLDVAATLTPPDTDPVGPVDLPFRWRPGGYRYGSNLTVPGDGVYDLEVRIDPATFPRRDAERGRRYEDRTVVGFEDVAVRCGQR